MGKDWVLVSDTRHARFFSLEGGDRRLVELADFVYPVAHRSTTDTGGTHKADLTKGHGRTGHAGTQFEPETDLHAKARDSFARQLAEYVNGAVSERLCDSIALIATGPMLAAIKEQLSPSASRMLRQCVASDLNHYTGRELQTRIQEALRLPA